MNWHPALCHTCEITLQYLSCVIKAVLYNTQRYKRNQSLQLTPSTVLYIKVSSEPAPSAVLRTLHNSCQYLVLCYTHIENSSRASTQYCTPHIEIRSTQYPVLWYTHVKKSSRNSPSIGYISKGESAFTPTP